MVTDSLKVADVFGKRTDNVMRDIDNIKKDILNFEEMFFEAEASDSYGRLQRIYYLNRDGLSLLVMVSLLFWIVDNVNIYPAICFTSSGRHRKRMTK